MVRFENLTVELQEMVVERLLFSEVMEICQTSKTIRQDRCRHLLRHWLRKHVPGAFIPANPLILTPGSPYIDGASPTQWIKIYTEAQIAPVIVVFTEIITQLQLQGVQYFNQNALQKVSLQIHEWMNRKINLERLPMRAATNCVTLLNLMIRIREWIRNDIDTSRHNLPRPYSQFQRARNGLILTLFLVVCGNSQTLRDIMSYTKEKWRALVLKYRYQDSARLNLPWRPSLPGRFLRTLLHDAPYDADDISIDLSNGEYAKLLHDGFITVSWDSLIARLANTDSAGESMILDALRVNLEQRTPHSRTIDIPHKATLESGIIRSQPWPALNRTLLEVANNNELLMQQETSKSDFPKP